MKNKIVLFLYNFRINKMSVKVAKYYPGSSTSTSTSMESLAIKDEDYMNVLIHTPKTNKWSSLSPYVLTVEREFMDGTVNNILIENHWQFSKLYPKVYDVKLPVSRYRPDDIVWEWNEETHVTTPNNKPNDNYWVWRQVGMLNDRAVRYPNGYHHKNEALCSIFQENENSETYRKLNYIEARKKIYCQDYIDCLIKNKVREFEKLKDLLSEGQNIQIIEVDGPNPTLTYPPYDQITIENPGMIMNEENIKLLLNDTRASFGHGFVIAALLLNGEEWLI